MKLSSKIIITILILFVASSLAGLSSVWLNKLSTIGEDHTIEASNVDTTTTNGRTINSYEGVANEDEKIISREEKMEDQKSKVTNIR